MYLKLQSSLPCVFFACENPRQNAAETQRRYFSVDFRWLTELHNQMWLRSTWMPGRLFPSAATDSLPVSSTVPCEGTNIRWKQRLMMLIRASVKRHKSHTQLSLVLFVKEKNGRFLAEVHLPIYFDCWQNTPETNWDQKNQICNDFLDNTQCEVPCCASPTHWCFTVMCL